MGNRETLVRQPARIALHERWGMRVPVARSLRQLFRDPVPTAFSNRRPETAPKFAQLLAHGLPFSYYQGVSSR